MDHEKAYKSLVAKIKNAHLYAQTDSTKNVLEDILPELRESEGERINKFLRHTFTTQYLCKDKTGKWHGEPVTNILAYLEKKDQPISAEEVLARAGLKPYKDGNQWCILAGDNIQEGICGFGDTIEDALYEFLKEVLDFQKEQKPALTPERIHPKFAVGDTVCRPMWSDHTIREIYVRCNDPIYVCVNEEGTESHISFSEQDEWERKEQKPTITSKFNVGDKIYYKGDSYNRYVIKEVREDYYINGFGQRMDMSYTDSNFELLEHLDDVPLVAPSKPAERSEDIIQKAVKEVGLTQHQIDWFKTNVFPTKQEWGDEDEKMVRFYENDYDNNLGNMPMCDVIENRIEFKDWLLNKLKFLRPQSHWKPSKAQKEAVQRAIDCLDGEYNDHPEELDSLLKDLEKLM